jgi:hypothetical protein
MAAQTKAYLPKLLWSINQTTVQIDAMLDEKYSSNFFLNFISGHVNLSFQGQLFGNMCISFNGPL